MECSKHRYIKIIQLCANPYDFRSKFSSVSHYLSKFHRLYFRIKLRNRHRALITIPKLLVNILLSWDSAIENMTQTASIYNHGLKMGPSLVQWINLSNELREGNSVLSADKSMASAFCYQLEITFVNYLHKSTLLTGEAYRNLLHPWKIEMVTLGKECCFIKRIRQPTYLL